MIGNVKLLPIKALGWQTSSQTARRNPPPVLFYDAATIPLRVAGRRPDDWRAKLAETRTAIKTSLQRPATLGSKILAVRLSDLASVRKKQVLWKAMSVAGHADRIPFAALCPDVLRAALSCAPKEN